LAVSLTTGLPRLQVSTATIDNNGAVLKFALHFNGECRNPPLPADPTRLCLEIPEAEKHLFVFRVAFSSSLWATVAARRFFPPGKGPGIKDSSLPKTTEAAQIIPYNIANYIQRGVFCEARLVLEVRVHRLLFVLLVAALTRGG